MFLFCGYDNAYCKVPTSRLSSLTITQQSAGWLHVTETPGCASPPRGWIKVVIIWVQYHGLGKFVAWHLDPLCSDDIESFAPVGFFFLAGMGGTVAWKREDSILLGLGR
jgi:hypothetical protein